MAADGPEYGLVMPFVACQSQGGAFDDAAFVSGYRLGEVNATLEHAKPERHVLWAHPNDVAQLDLIAMRQGYTLTTEAWDEHPDEWVEAVLLRADSGPESGEQSDECSSRPPDS